MSCKNNGIRKKAEKIALLLNRKLEAGRTTKPPPAMLRALTIFMLFYFFGRGNRIHRTQLSSAGHWGLRRECWRRASPLLGSPGLARSQGYSCGDSGRHEIDGGGAASSWRVRRRSAAPNAWLTMAEAKS